MNALHVAEPTDGVAEPGDFAKPESIGHAQEQVCHGLRVVLDIATGAETATARPGKEYRQIAVGMTIGIGITATVDDHRIMEDRLAIKILCGFELLEEPAELTHVPEVDIGHLIHPIGPVLVVGQVVMPFRDPDVFE